MAIYISVFSQNLVVNGDLEEIKLRSFDRSSTIDGITYSFKGIDTAFDWGLMDKRLALLQVKGWGYDQEGSVESTGYYSNIGLSRSGTNLNVIEVYKTWSASGASVKNAVASLCKPLIKGKRYEIVFYVRPLYGNYFTKNIGVVLLKDQVPTDFNFDPERYMESIKKGHQDKASFSFGNAPVAFQLPEVLTDTTQYTRISFEYEAQGGEQYVYIGNLFFASADFWKKKSWKKVSQYGIKENMRNYFMCYYAVDDLSLIALDSNETGCPTTVTDDSASLVTDNGEAKPDTLLLGEVNFGFDHATTEKELTALIASINAHLETGSSILIIGHTDDEGSAGYNENLSIERAEFIKSILAPYYTGTIKTLGLGARSPKYLESQKSLNRRVEVYLIYD